MIHDNIDEIYLFQLAKTFKQFKKYKNKCFKEAGLGITDDQWILLKTIHEDEGLNQRQLANKAHKEPASVTRILDILVRKTWIERRLAPNNRRTYELYLTKAGLKLVRKVLPLAIKIRKQGAKGLSDKKIAKLSDSLNQIFANYSDAPK